MISLAVIAIVGGVVLAGLWVQRAFRWMLIQSEERIRRSILDEIDASRAQRMADDAELCAWLIRWRDGARVDIATMRAITDEFNGLLSPYMVDGDGTQN